MAGKINDYYLITGILLTLVILIIPVTAADITEYLNTNLPGNDYNTVAAPDKLGCAMACLKDNECQAATWVYQIGREPFCLLKNAVPAQIPFPGNMTTVMHSYIKDGAVTTRITRTCNPVTAGFTEDTISGTAPLSIHFIDTTIGQGETVWIWGDGSQLTAASQSEVDHTYTKPGIYTVNLTVSNACDISSATKTIRVTGVEGTPARGDLRITGVPDGATLYIDTVRYGIFPLNPFGLTAGPHTIRIAMSGYDDYTTDIMIAANQQLVLNLMVTAPDNPLPSETTADSSHSTAGSPLKKALTDLTLTQAANSTMAAGTGILIISSNPAGANVYIKGKSVGITPVTIPGMTAGEHNILLTRQGYTDTARSINVTPGSETRVTVDMTAAKKTPGFAAMTGFFSVTLLVMIRKRIR